MSNKQRLMSNEQRLISTKQRLMSNKQSLISSVTQDGDAGCGDESLCRRLSARRPGQSGHEEDVDGDAGWSAVRPQVDSSSVS